MQPIFAQITKVDEEKRIVYGRAAEEVVDRSGEVFDYQSSKPYFQAWSEAVRKDSGGKSLGNVRSMHGNVAAGKLVDLQFLDDQRAIDVVAKIVDDNEWRKVLEGVHTGFSIGGSYVDRRTELIEGKEVKRYTANPNEISLVDRPCIPTAKFFDVLKADGSVQHVAFVNTDTLSAPLQEKNPMDSTPKSAGADTDPLANPQNSATEDEFEVLGTDADVEALSKFMNDQKLTVSDVLAMTKALAPARSMLFAQPAELVKVDGVAPTEADVRKYITTAADFAYCVQCVHTLWKRIAAEGEELHAGLLVDLKACLGSLADCMKTFVDQEVEELKAGKEEAEALVAVPQEVKAMYERLGDMTKADFADNLVALLKYGARNNKADQERIQRIHDVTVEMMAKCNTPVKADSGGDLAKTVGAAPTVPEEAIQKAVQSAVEPLQKTVENLQNQLSAAQTELAKLASQPAPARVRLRAVAKGEDLSQAEYKETQVAPVTVQGQVNEVATLIKAAHSTGGRPFLRKD